MWKILVNYYLNWICVYCGILLAATAHADNNFHVPQTSTDVKSDQAIVISDETDLALQTEPRIAARQPLDSELQSNRDQQLYQEAPGAERIRSSASATQAYNYLLENYDEPGVGIRAYADYAPQGYYPLDYQEAPGAALYQPLTRPVSATPEELEKSVIRGPLPGSFIVPGTNTAFRFSGFVRMGANFDFDPIGTPDLFVTRTIPVPQESGQNMNFSARPTRLSMDTWTPVPDKDLMVHTFLQFDFLSGNPPAVGSSSNPRLRFAYFDVGYFRVGQDTTVFMDPGAFPRTADFQGPNGIVNSRQGLVRMTLPLTERISLATAAEQPFTDITTLGLGDNVQDVPDFTSHLRYEADLFHTQVSSIVRTLGYQPTGGQVMREAGWGVNFTGAFHPWAYLMCTNPVRDPNPSPLTRSRVLLQYAFGSGIGRYIQDTSGIGLDGAVDLNGDFQTLDIQGGTASYEHWFSDRWLTTLTYSNVNVLSTDAQPGTTFAGSDYVAAALWWIPMRNMSIGAEFLYGERENQNGERGRADRIQTVFQYNF
jgi:hypothetical protein